MKVQLKKTQSLLDTKSQAEEQCVQKMTKFNFYSPRISCENMQHNSSSRNLQVLNAESQKFISMTPKS